MTVCTVSYAYRLNVSGAAMAWESIEECVQGIPEDLDEGERLRWLAVHLPLVRRLQDLIELRELKVVSADTI